MNRKHLLALSLLVGCVELAQFAPLVCAVHSGGKSLHGWFAVRGQPEEKVRRFFSYAVMLGADPATWTRSQFVRIPAAVGTTGTCRWFATAIPLV